MHIDYLHLTQPGQPVSGVTRYGRQLAAAVRDRLPQSGSAVTETEVGLGRSLESLQQAAAALSAAQVVHLQFSQFVWHPALVPFLAQLQKPLVVTLHDLHQHLYPRETGLRLLWQENRRQRSRAKSNSLSLRSTGQQLQRYRHDRQVLASVLEVADLALVCHSCEKQQIAHLPGAEKIAVIPHFVESRSLPSAEQAKAQLQLSNSVVTLQGYVYPHKGHEIALRALALLPEITLVFAGGPTPGGEGFLQQLRSLADTLGIAHRLRITGYLSEADLDLYLAATDVAICPFQALSASGSLSTWIAAGKPIVATDLPQIREYNQWADSPAIAIFSPCTPAALAQQIRAQLETPRTAVCLQDRLGLGAIAKQHLAAYRQLL